MVFDPTQHQNGGSQGPAENPQAPVGEAEDTVLTEAGEAPSVGAGVGPEAAGADAAGAAEEPNASLSAQEIAALAETAAKADEYLALAQRKQAEFENFRKRAARDAAAAGERGTSKLALALLPALDNLERALAHAPDDDLGTPSGAQATHGFVAGVRHVHSDLIAALQKAGIEQFSPQGEPFDPTRHEAIAQQPAPEGVGPGTVVEVYQRGYRMGETVVRPARVVVAG